MSYTATYDVSMKVQVAGAGRTMIARHLARDADERHGFSFGHTNENIDSKRTSLNVTRVNDGKGGYRELKPDGYNAPSVEIDKYLDERLKAVERKPRKDAVAMRGVILQVDPKWFDENNPDWRENGLNPEAQKLVEAQLRWAEGEFGQQNIVMYSLHLDETSPQLHVLMTPVTEDGRLAQKDFFKGPHDLRRQHDSMRKALAEAGLDVEMGRTDRSGEHLSSDEFAKKADRQRKREFDLDDREASLVVAETEVSLAKEKVEKAEERLSAANVKIMRERLTLARERGKVESRLQEAAKVLEQARQVYTESREYESQIRKLSSALQTESTQKRRAEGMKAMAAADTYLNEVSKEVGEGHSRKY